MKNTLLALWGGLIFVLGGLGIINRGEIVEYIVPGRTEDVAPLPVLGETDEFPVLSAQGVIAIDMDSGVSLYEKDADKKLLPASTTKIMTALVAMEYFDGSEVLTANMPYVEGQKMKLVRGERILVEDLIQGLLIYSANDAAEALAAAYPGGREVFVATMNRKAEQLSLNNTYFKNPTGLDGNSHRSTARDLVRLSEIAMREPRFASVVGMEEAVVESVDEKFRHYLRSTNELLGDVEGVKGVKTGWTENARENLVTYVERDNRKVLIAVMGSQDRFGETRELIDWIFDNYSWTVLSYD